MENRKWPNHYTKEDIQAVLRIDAWLAERAENQTGDKKFSQAALARLARVSPSTLNQILKGTYLTKPGKQLIAVESAMKHADETEADAIVPVETSVFKLAITCCKMARRYRNIAVLSAFVGVGKTFSLKHYTRSHANTYMIEATPTMTSRGLIRQLARNVAGYASKGSIDEHFNAVVESLRNTDSLIIIDEAETLTAHQLHTLRRLRDLANIGIVLSGTEHLTGMIRPEHGQFDQLRSRTGFWPETVRQITLADASALVQASFEEEVPEDVIERMYRYCRGSARMLVEGLVAAIKEFRKNNPLDAKLVDAVARQALCLQSIA